MKKGLFAILLGTILILGACGGDDNSDNGAVNNHANEIDVNSNNKERADTVDTAAAEELYKQNCSSCHAGDLSGNMAPSLTTVGTDYDADEIADIIENGTDRGMPASIVSGDDVDVLANWLAEMK